MTPVLKSWKLYGENNLLSELLIGSNGQFENCCHLSLEDFELLLGFFMNTSFYFLSDNYSLLDPTIPVLLGTDQSLF